MNIINYFSIIISRYVLHKFINTHKSAQKNQEGFDYVIEIGEITQCPPAESINETELVDSVKSI